MPRGYEEWEISLHLTAITQAVIAWCPWILTEGPAWNGVPWVVPCPWLGVRCYLDVTYAGRCGYILPRRVWLSLPWTLWSCGEETTWISVRRSNGKTMLDAQDVVQRWSGPLRREVPVPRVIETYFVDHQQASCRWIPSWFPDAMTQGHLKIILPARIFRALSLWQFLPKKSPN